MYWSFSHVPKGKQCSFRFDSISWVWIHSQYIAIVTWFHFGELITGHLQGYKPPNEEPSEYQSIPLEKIEDFGVHCKQYYSLDVTYFKSALDRKLLDSLWNKYWVNTLSSSSLITSDDYLTGQIYDLSKKFEQSELQIGRYIPSVADVHEKRVEDKLLKAVKDSNKTIIEILQGLMAQTIKDKLFNNVSLKSNPSPLNTVE